MADRKYWIGINGYGERGVYTRKKATKTVPVHIVAADGTYTKRVMRIPKSWPKDLTATIEAAIRAKFGDAPIVHTTFVPQTTGLQVEGVHVTGKEAGHGKP